jgi:hypothetical protein
VRTGTLAESEPMRYCGPRKGPCSWPLSLYCRPVSRLLLRILNQFTNLKMETAISSETSVPMYINHKTYPKHQWRSQSPPWKLSHKINIITKTILIYLAPKLQEAFKTTMVYKNLQRKLPPGNFYIITNSATRKITRLSLVSEWGGGRFERGSEHWVKLQKTHPFALQLLSTGNRSLLQSEVYPSPPPLEQFTAT